MSGVRFAAAQEQRRMPPWLVWFAWHPVLVLIKTETAHIHDEVVIERSYRWQWLRHVARQANPCEDEFGLSPVYYYAPVHVALTQSIT